MPSSPDPRASVARPRATVLGAYVEGWRRVLRAPALGAGMLAVTFLLALPMALALGTMLRAHLGESREADRAAAGWNAGWAAEFGAQAQGLGQTFSHEILGFGGTLANLSNFIDARPLNPALAGAAAVYVALWMFFSGGILDRLARGRPVRAAAFFAACGVYFLRFLRLAIVIGAAYWLIFAVLHPYLLGRVYGRWIRDVTVEREAIVVRALLYAVVLLALAAVNLVADFAKVRAVVEDRRSMLGAILASLRFIRRCHIRVAGLYLLNVLGLLIVMRLWMSLAPSAAAPSWSALFIAQVYLLVRIWTKLAFMASEVVFFQGELAHATYTAAAPLVWPESAAAEAIDNLVNNNN